MGICKNRTRFVLCLLGAILANICRADDPAVVPASITVEPATVEINHPRQPYVLQVLGISSDRYSLDLHSSAKFMSADPHIATVDASGKITPVSSGQTIIKVAVAGQTRTVTVKVQLPSVEPVYSFRHEVMPVLSRAGCNSGACHGYSLGKNGFKLSLRGGDPEQDLFAITKEVFSRRVSYEFPGQSMIVAKPCGDIPHEGGVRFSAEPEPTKSWWHGSRKERQAI